MKYAVVTSGGKQYKVIEGQILILDRIKAQIGTQYLLDKVLLTVDGDMIRIGSPYLDNASVTAKVLEQVKGKKIRVAKFKAKARYRKVQGFRPELTKVEIVALSAKFDRKPAPKEKAKQ